MALDDFDVDSLAAYLHMMPAQIGRLAERGKLPARRIGGQWRFSRPEIHHWLEERIGLSDANELEEMEGVLTRTAEPEAPEEVRITDLMLAAAIAVPLNARTKSSVISKMCELAADSGVLWDPVKMAEAVAAREQMHPTALDVGAALMHPRRPMSGILSEALVAIGITSTGVPFGGQGLTDVFFLICSTSDHEHLRILARLSRLISDANWLAELRSLQDPQQVVDLIEQQEAQW